MSEDPSSPQDETPKEEAPAEEPAPATEVAKVEEPPKEEPELPKAGPETLEEAEEESQIARELLQKRKEEAPTPPVTPEVKVSGEGSTETVDMPQTIPEAPAPAPEPEPIPPATEVHIEKDVEVVDDEKEQSIAPAILEDPRRAKLQELCERVIDDEGVREQCMLTIDESLKDGQSVPIIIDKIASQYSEHIDLPEGEFDDKGEYIPPVGDEPAVTPSEFVAVPVPEVPPPPPVPTILPPKLPPKKTREQDKPTP